MAIDFSKYQKKGGIDFSKYQKREVGGTGSQVSMGLASSGWGLVRGMADLGQSALDQTGGRIANLLTGKGFTPTNSRARTAETSGPFGDAFGRYLQPQTGVEQGVKLGADIAQFFMPAGSVNRATEGMSFVPRVLSRTAPDVGIAGAQAAGSGEDAGTVAGVTGVTSAVGNALLPGRPMSLLSSTAAGGATGYTSDVATGLTGMRGEDRDGAAAFIPGFGTAAGLGLGAGTGALTKNKVQQEQVTQAVDDLESKYKDISRGWVTTRKMSDKSAATTNAKNKSGTQGRTPERVLAESGIVPQLDGTKFSTKTQSSQLRESTAPLRAANRQALQEASYSTQPVKLSDLESAAIRRARSDKNIAAGTADKLVEKIKKEFETYRKNYGDTVSLIELDDIKAARWESTGFSLTKDDKLAGDVDYLIAKAAQRRIEDVAAKAGATDVAQLNRELGDIHQAVKYLEALDGRAVLYGRMGTHMTRLAGAVAGSSGGPLGTIAGAMGGDVLAGMLRSNYVSSASKRIILKNLRTQDPQSYINTLRWLKNEGLDREMRELLPAPRFMEMGAPKDQSGVSMAPAAWTAMQDPQTGRFGRAYTQEVRGQSQGNLPSAKNEYTAQTTTANASEANIPTANTQTGQNANKVIPKSTAAQQRRVSEAAQKEVLREIDAQIEALEDAVSNAPIKSVASKVGRGDNSLSQLQENAIRRGTNKRNIDRYSDIDQLGYKDLDEAQDALEKYQIDKERLAQMKQARKDLRDQMKRGEDLYAYDNPAFYDDAEEGLVGGSRNAMPKVAENQEFFAGAAMGFEMDEEGNLTFNPETALMGVAGMAAAQRINPLKVERFKNAVEAKLPAMNGASAKYSIHSPSSVPVAIKRAYEAMTDQKWPDKAISLAEIKKVQSAARELYDQHGKKLMVKSSDGAPNLLQEAKKYKTMDEFVKAQTSTRNNYGYGYDHRPTEGPRAFNLTEKVDGEEMIPSDMYEQWYGSRGTLADKESIAALQKIKGKPDASVTIYRAAPTESWNYGDWVTLSKKYAQEHKTSNAPYTDEFGFTSGKDLNIYEKTVKAKDLKWAADDINEFGYFPESTRSQLEDIWKQANK